MVWGMIGPIDNQGANKSPQERDDYNTKS